MFDAHGVGGIGPDVLVVVRAFGVFLELELLDRVGLGAIGQARQEPRHGQAEVPRVLRVAQGAPGGVFGGLEDLGQVARVAQFLPGFHAASASGAAAAMNGACAAAAICAISPSISTSGGRVVEIVVADQAAVGLAAGRAVFVLIQLLEERALVPGRALEFLEGLAAAPSWRCSSTRILSISSVSVLLTR